MSWYTPAVPPVGESQIPRSLEPADNSAGLTRGDRQSDVGQMLWAANWKSVKHRYPDVECFGADPPEYGRHVLNGTGAVTPARTLRACDCYEYQSCEDPGFYHSEAFAFVYALRSAAWHALPDYDNGEWGIE